MTHDPSADQSAGWRRLSVYLEPRDWWIGVYVAPGAVFVCPLPTLVIRWQRRPRPISPARWAAARRAIEDDLVRELTRVDVIPPPPPPRRYGPRM